MILVFNWQGLLVLGSGLLLGILLRQAMGWVSWSAPFLLMGITGIAGDLYLRLKQPGKNLMHPDRGGNLFWVPAWICGAVFFIIGFYLMWHRAG